MEIRNRKRQKLTEKRGHRSADLFRIGDLVRLQDPKSKKWSIKGTITEIRHTEDGSQSSFNIKKEKWKDDPPSHRHCHHNISVDDRLEPCRVHFRRNPR